MNIIKRERVCLCSGCAAFTLAQWVGSDRVCVCVWIAFTKHGHSASEPHWISSGTHTHTQNNTTLYHTSAVSLSVIFLCLTQTIYFPHSCYLPERDVHNTFITLLRAPIHFTFNGKTNHDHLLLRQIPRCLFADMPTFILTTHETKTCTWFAETFILKLFPDVDLHSRRAGIIYEALGLYCKEALWWIDLSVYNSHYWVVKARLSVNSNTHGSLGAPNLPVAVNVPERIPLSFVGLNEPSINRQADLSQKGEKEAVRRGGGPFGCCRNFSPCFSVFLDKHADAVVRL